MNKYCFVCTFVCFLFSTQAIASKKKSVVLMIQTTSSKSKNQKTSARLQWMLRNLAQKDIQNKNLRLFHEETFLFKSGSKGAKARFRRAIKAAKEAVKQYRKDPALAQQSLYMAHRFFQYSHAFESNPKLHRQISFLLALTKYRDTEFEQTFSFASFGHLLQSRQTNFSPVFSPTEKELLSRIRCDLSQRKRGSLHIKTKRGDARIFLNGQLAGIGTTSLKKMVPGEYMLKVLQPGKKPWVQSIRLRANQQRKVQARGYRSSQSNFYKQFCGKLMQANVQEKLQDTLESFQETLSNGSGNKVDRMLLGCYLPSGTLHWFAFQTGNPKMTKRGQISVSKSTSILKGRLGKLLTLISLQVDGTADVARYAFQHIPRENQCKPWDRFKIKRLKGGNKSTNQDSWPVSVGDHVSVLFKFGLTVEGKMKEIKGKAAILEVNPKVSTLQSVAIRRSEVKHIQKLGARSSRGYRVNETIFIETTFRLTVKGKFLRDDGSAIEIQTRYGFEVIPWSQISKVTRAYH